MSLLRSLVTRSSKPTARIFTSPNLCALRPQLVRKSLSQHTHTLKRTFASAPGGAGSRVAAAAKPAGSRVRVPQPRPDQELLPDRLLIYHAGTGRIAFLAFLKITTVFSAAFFTLVALPSWVRSEDVDAFTLATKFVFGITPFLFVAWTSAPFVTYIYLRLPGYARESRAVMERYVRALPPTAQLEIGTMGLASRPRATLVSASDLRPLPARAGIVATRIGTVNHERDVSALAAKRKWHQYRPVARFLLPEAAPGNSASRGSRGGVKEGWVWGVVRQSLGKRK